MSTKNQPGGRRASVMQREFAGEVLSRFEASGEVEILRDAIEHFSRTGDFSPYCDRDQMLQKRAIYHRLQIKVKGLRGKALADYIDQVSQKYGLSEQTVKRLLLSKKDIVTTLTGPDALFAFLQVESKK